MPRYFLIWEGGKRKKGEGNDKGKKEKKIRRGARDPKRKEIIPFFSHRRGKKGRKYSKKKKKGLNDPTEVQTKRET